LEPFGISFIITTILYLRVHPFLFRTTYKRVQILEKCLEYWSQSLHQPDQFIVVDATPNAEEYSTQMVDKFSSLFSKTNSRYIVIDKPGLTHQRNIGLREMNTDIVCFVDDDTFVSPDYVTKVLNVFQLDKFNVVGGVNGSGHWSSKT